MRTNHEIAGYRSKSGSERNYKVLRKSNKFGKDRVLLRSFGKEPVEFWVDADKLLPAFPVKARPGAETRQCWECGCSFTWADAQNQGGDWNDCYCGC